ncbi:PREDICTED: tensin-4 [Chaetura pelagica]|uniref:tensin-4 n=1 Tax=Chaetura pelagica TaxID=8897 RepID=UPI00052344CF|nr:PREDICTED: tensin-4 [Chaetura pelagica]
MSQVIQNHVLRVGQTVCVSSQEESKSFPPVGYPGCSTLPLPYGYYSAEGWAGPPAMVHPRGGLYGPHPVLEHVAAPAQGKGQQDPPLERCAALCQPQQEEDTGGDPEAHLVSPTLDISIESLNQLILEIDPTFQPLTCKPGKDVVSRRRTWPLTCKPGKDVVQPAAQHDAAATKKQDPEAMDIKYIEMTPGRATCPELLPGSPSPLGTPFSRSPQSNSFLPQKGGLRGNYSTSGSVVFSSPPRPTSPDPGAPTCSTASEPPAHSGTSCGPGALGTSPGFDNLLKPVQVVRAQQRSSWVSQLSTSPGSDTSYILGSSTHSLHNEDSDALPAAGGSTDCLSPASSLGSPCPPSPSIGSHSGEAFGQSPHQPRTACSIKANTSLPQKGQASSRPPPSSWVSQLSTSPGSDTSYILGSSTHSLHNEDSDAPPAAGGSTDCLSPASSLGSPCPPSPSIGSHSGEAFGQSPHQPRTACSIKANTSLPQKGQASSCPPSILNSTADIPVLLVNGCLEQGDAHSRQAKPPSASAKQSPPPSCSPTLRLGGLNNALSAPALSCVPDSSPWAGQPTMKFVMDTSKYWFKPSITRDRAVQLLRAKEPGAFVVRDSTSYRGSFGLAMKVPPASPAGGHTGDEGNELVRHFLIESSAKGVRLKGASEELYFGSLSAFVYQHSITPLALPCRLSIPTRDLADGEDSPDCVPESTLSLLKKTAVCNVLYLNSVNVETLTGSLAVQKAISSTFELELLPTPTLVHFKVAEQGVTLTDVQRKVFFRRHYPLAAIRFCGMDPENRKWQKYCKSSRIFGLVAKSQTDSENLCHLFAEYDTVQPASLVIDLLCKLRAGP